MKRQERLALFFEREQALLNELLQEVSGFAGLYFGSRMLNLQLRLKHFFLAGHIDFKGADAIFSDGEWPLPADYCDLVVLDHPLDLGCDLEATFAEALRVLRRDGSLVITGFNKTRLCSWPVQNTFGKTVACPIKRYSSLTLLSKLDEAGFLSEIRYFDFCRFSLWNKIFAKVIPFLGIGFIIVAKRKTISLKPLEELTWNFAPQDILRGALQPKPEYCGEKKDVHS